MSPKLRHEIASLEDNESQQQENKLDRARTPFFETTDGKKAPRNPCRNFELLVQVRVTRRSAAWGLVPLVAGLVALYAVFHGTSPTMPPTSGGRPGPNASSEISPCPAIKFTGPERPRATEPEVLVRRTRLKFSLSVVFVYILVFTTAWGHSRDAGIPGPGERWRLPGQARPAVSARPWPCPCPVQRAMEYYHSSNCLWVINPLGALIVPGFCSRFSDFSARLQKPGRGDWGACWFFTIGLYMIMFLAIMYAIDFPLSYYQGFVRQHAYGLSNQTLTRWLRNSIVRLAVDMAVAFALGWVPYLLLAYSPRRWWLYTAILSVPFLFVTMLVVPVFYDPLFNKFGPMNNKELERSILALADRAGIEGSRVFEVDKSADTNAVNAYVTGFWQSKRIVLWDTLIKKLSEPRAARGDGPRNGALRAGARSAVDPAVVDRDLRRTFPG